jgi:hypothetical protein
MTLHSIEVGFHVFFDLAFEEGQGDLADQAFWVNGELEGDPCAALYRAKLKDHGFEGFNVIRGHGERQLVREFCDFMDGEDLSVFVLLDGLFPFGVDALMVLRDEIYGNGLVENSGEDLEVGEFGESDFHGLVDGDFGFDSDRHTRDDT